jgi:hypothetical protein
MGPIIVGIVITVAVISAAAMMMLEQIERTKRSNKALEVIQTALQQGKEPAPELYRALEPAGPEKTDQRWSNVIVFSALAVGFGAAAITAYPEGGSRFQAFAIIGAAMTVTAIGSLLYALFAKKPSRE